MLRRNKNGIPCMEIVAMDHWEYPAFWHLHLVQSRLSTHGWIILFCCFCIVFSFPCFGAVLPEEQQKSRFFVGMFRGMWFVVGHLKCGTWTPEKMAPGELQGWPPFDHSPHGTSLLWCCNKRVNIIWRMCDVWCWPFSRCIWSTYIF